MSRAVSKKSQESTGSLLDVEVVVDRKNGLVFQSEEEAYKHFLPMIKRIEKEFRKHRKPSDVSEKSFGDYHSLLPQVLQDPDEVWETAVSAVKSQSGFRYRTFIGHFSNPNGTSLYYVVTTYPQDLTKKTEEGDGEDSDACFVYFHFPSEDLELVDRFRRGELIYNRVLKDVEKGAVAGDALSEGDELAVGLYKAMLKVRQDKDLPEEEFKEYEGFREETIENGDEIWRNTDLYGNVLVSFIREFPDQGVADLYYIVVTVEDEEAGSHMLLFSFPTNDLNLVERYRNGENLHADEIVQEASH